MFFTESLEKTTFSDFDETCSHLTSQSFYGIRKWDERIDAFGDSHGFLQIIRRKVSPCPCSIPLSLDRYIALSLSVYLAISLFLCLSLYILPSCQLSISVSLSIYLSISSNDEREDRYPSPISHLSIYCSALPSGRLSLWLSISVDDEREDRWMAIYLFSKSIYRSIYLSARLSASLYPSLWMMREKIDRCLPICSLSISIYLFVFLPMCLSISLDDGGGDSQMSIYRLPCLPISQSLNHLINQSIHQLTADRFIYRSIDC